MYNSLEAQRSIREIKAFLKPISLHDLPLTKCAFIVFYYPIKKSKLDIYLKLDNVQRVGMLNRYILGVASKLGIYQIFLRQFVGLKRENKRYKNYIKSGDLEQQFWIEQYRINQIELSKMFNLLLDMMIEEINRRNNPKYLRKKKLDEIIKNL